MIPPVTTSPLVATACQPRPPSISTESNDVKRILIATALLFVTSGAVFVFIQSRSIPAEISNDTLTVDGVERHYRIVIPHGLPETAPIVFAFHGIGDSTESMALYSRLDRLAVRSGFVLVYPAALKSMWATANVDLTNPETIPDVRFFDELLENLASHRSINLNRVYLVGMSNGASFAQVLAAARAEKVAAIVAHSGAKPHDLPTKMSRPAMLIVGAEDSAMTAMQADVEQYRSHGTVVEFLSIPGLGHEWSSRHNAEMWKFLSRQTLNGERGNAG